MNPKVARGVFWIALNSLMFGVNLGVFITKLAQHRADLGSFGITVCGGLVLALVVYVNVSSMRGATS